MKQLFSWLVMFSLGVCVMASDEQEEHVQKVVQKVALIEALMGPEVVDELEIVGKQRERFNQIRKDFLEQRKIELNRDFGIEIPADKPPISKEAFAETLEELLLPHQLKRLKQLQIQRAVLSGNDATYGITRMRKILALEESQLSAIRKNGQKIESELGKEIERFLERVREIRVKGQTTVKKELNQKQRAVYDELIGKDFFAAKDLSGLVLRHTQRENAKRLEQRGPSDE